MPVARGLRGAGRRCILHDRRCVWAGGDGSFERGVAALVAQVNGGEPQPGGFESAAQCRQASESDRQQGLGIFAPSMPAIDPAVAALAEEVAAAPAVPRPPAGEHDALRHATITAKPDGRRFYGDGCELEPREEPTPVEPKGDVDEGQAEVEAELSKPRRRKRRGHPYLTVVPYQ